MRLSPLVFAALLTWASFARAEPPRPLAAASTDPMLFRDVPYQVTDGIEQRLDVAVPRGEGPFPLVLCIHGGAWRMGDKSKYSSMINDLARHGYVAATMNYRFAPKYRFPAQLDDTRAALLYLKGKAADYKIDVNHVGALGESAGSHLAMLMSFIAAGSTDPAERNPATSTRLQAIANYYGPVDLGHIEVAPLVEFLWKERFHESMTTAMLDFLGAKSAESPEVKQASPLAHVTKLCPPILTFHGTLDPVVPFHQAELLHAALHKAGVDQKLVPIPNGLHGGWAPAAKGAADAQARAFFDQYLKGDPNARAIEPDPQRNATAETDKSGVLR